MAIPTMLIGYDAQRGETIMLLAKCEKCGAVFDVMWREVPAIVLCAKCRVSGEKKSGVNVEVIGDSDSIEIDLTKEF